MSAACAASVDAAIAAAQRNPVMVRPRSVVPIFPSLAKRGGDGAYTRAPERASVRLGRREADRRGDVADLGGQALRIAEIRCRDPHEVVVELRGFDPRLRGERAFNWRNSAMRVSMGSLSSCLSRGG